MKVLLLGAGPVGLEKLEALLANSPLTQIRVVALEVLPAVQQLAARHAHVTIHQKAYEPTDLDEAQLVITALNNKELSARVKAAANQRGLLVNVADTPDLCDFYLSSVVRKGHLKIAISTNGKSPTIAKRLRETLQDAIPADLNEVLDNMEAIRSRLNGNFEEKVKRLNKITSVLAVSEQAEKAQKWRKVAQWSLIVFASMLIGHFIFSYINVRQVAGSIGSLYGQLDANFHWMLLAGFLAQMVDGALGMGYGVTSATILLSSGVNPAAISGSIHTAEMFASGASGYSHYKFGNVNKKMFKALVIPGVLGAIGGALLLVYLGEKHANYVRPVLACYTM
ncbi:MAG TPA: TSUP family transporter, partial [Phnomibacter sp.]|nr:TSUP family transporter [Phnomibacter sp.]